MAGLFQKGMKRPEGSGRRKGVPNKRNIDLYHAILKGGTIKGNRILSAEGKRTRGGIVALIASLPLDLYVQLLVRILPKEVVSTIDATVRPAPMLTKRLEELTDAELEAFVIESQAHKMIASGS